MDFEKLKPIELNKLPPNPLVSILMANYNYSEFIGEAIESVIKQTYTNWELIICDDGSTDISIDVIRNYCKSNRKIALITKKNAGQATALNEAYKNAKGEIIAILDSDDVFYQKKLEKVIYTFNKNSQSGFCIHKLVPIDIRGKIISKTFPNDLENGWVAIKAISHGGGNSKLPPASGLTFRKEITNQIFPINVKFKSNADAVLSELAQYLTLI